MSIQDKIDNISVGLKTGLLVLITTIIVLIGFMAALSFMRADSAAQSKQMVERIRTERTDLLQTYFSQLEEDMVLQRDNPFVGEALGAFNESWKLLGEDPTSVLQSLYITNNPHQAAERSLLDRADDNMLYNRMHAYYHPWFRSLVQERGYQDLILLDGEGNIIYSVGKYNDFGRNVRSEILRETGLDQLFSSLKQTGDGVPRFEDFSTYPPQNTSPHAFIGVALKDSEKFEGALIVSLNQDAFTQIETSAFDAANAHIIVIAEDFTLRSAPPEALADTTFWDNAVTRAAMQGSEADGMVTNSSQEAFYVTVEPLNFFNQRWAVAAALPKAALTYGYWSNIWIIGGGLVLITGLSLLAMRLAREWIAVPVMQLSDITQRLIYNPATTILHLNREDEVGALANSLNEVKYKLEQEADDAELPESEPEPASTMLPELETIAEQKEPEIEPEAPELPEEIPLEEGENSAEAEDVQAFEEASSEAAEASPAAKIEQNKPEERSMPVIKPWNDGEEAAQEAEPEGDIVSATPVTQGSDNIHAVVRKLSRNFEATVKHVVDMVSSAAVQMEATAQSMAAGSDVTNRKITELTEASAQAADNIHVVANAAEELTSSIGEIARQVAKSAEISDNAVREANSANKTIAGLSDAAQKIDDVVNLINDIAEQINLLALNATIEAARAEDAGKGFAVVASEVKSLANQTAKATQDIAGQISSIQSETGNAVDFIESITETIERMNDISTAISAAVEEQGAATQEIARSVQKAADNSQQVSNNVKDVHEASEENGASANEMLGACSELTKQSEILNREVDRFLEDLSAIEEDKK